MGDLGWGVCSGLFGMLWQEVASLCGRWGQRVRARLPERLGSGASDVRSGPRTCLSLALPVRTHQCSYVLGIEQDFQSLSSSCGCRVAAAGIIKPQVTVPPVMRHSPGQLFTPLTHCPMNTSLLPRRILKESWRWGKLHQSVIAGVAYLACLWVPVGDVEGAGGPGHMGHSKYGHPQTGLAGPPVGHF